MLSLLSVAAFVWVGVWVWPVGRVPQVHHLLRCCCWVVQLGTMGQSKPGSTWYWRRNPSKHLYVIFWRLKCCSYNWIGPPTSKQLPPVLPTLLPLIPSHCGTAHSCWWLQTNPNNGRASCRARLDSTPIRPAPPSNGNQSKMLEPQFSDQPCFCKYRWPQSGSGGTWPWGPWHPHHSRHVNVTDQKTQANNM